MDAPSKWSRPSLPRGQIARPIDHQFQPDDMAEGHPCRAEYLKTLPQVGERCRLLAEAVGLKLISWNVADRTGLLDEQARALLRQEPDIVALQEVRASTLPRWRRALAGAGLEVALDSSALAGTRRLFNLTAARWPAIDVPSPPGPQPERVVSALIETPPGPLELHNTHVPPAPGNGLAWLEACEAIH